MYRHIRHFIFLLFIVLITSALISCQKNKETLALPFPSDFFAEVTTDYPYVVMVVGPGGRGLCSGIFISERAVLTASHCVQESGQYTVIASFGIFASNDVVTFGPGVLNDPNDIGLIIFPITVAFRDQGQVAEVGDTVFEGDVIRVVGFGCNDFINGGGAGVKRTGTNVVYLIRQYIELRTPLTSGVRTVGTYGIMGPVNRAGACFGDSGSPMLRAENDVHRLVGTSHSGGHNGTEVASDYIDLTRSDNRNFLVQVNQDRGLGIFP